MIQLFPDQIELIDATREAMRTSKAVLMQSPTGSGKMVMLSSMIETATRREKTSMMLVPRRELLNQCANTFTEFNIPHSFIAAGYGFNPYSKAYLATVGTLVNRLDKAPKLDLLAVDETHHGHTALDKIINHYKKQGTYILGASATPTKLSGRGLKCWYDKMVRGKSIRWLIDHKRLSDYRLFAPDTPDMTGIKTVAGDYSHGQLADKMEHDRILVGRLVDHYRTHAMGRINVTFSVSRKHSEILNQSFLDAGIPSACVDGETPDIERKKIFRALAKRELLNVVNCELLTFGFDIASAAGMDVTVESISVGRPTQSLALWMQIIGRVLRYKEFPALIFDHAGNTARFGSLPCDEREWTLEDNKKSVKDKSEKTVAVRQCPKCDFVHKPAPVCPNCQHVYEIQSREIDEVDGELAEITAADIKKKEDKKNRRAACKTIDELIKFAEDEGINNPVGYAAKWWSIRESYKRGARR